MGITLRTNGFDHVFGKDVEQRATKAMRKTLSELAYKSMNYLRAQSRLEIDTSRAFFRNSIQYQSAGSRLQSKVGILDRVPLAEHIAVGSATRSPLRSKRIAVPIGNIETKPRSLIGKKGAFTQRTRAGNLVLFKSIKGGGLKPLYAFEKTTKYTQPTFHFEDHVNDILTTFQFGDSFWEAFNV